MADEINEIAELLDQMEMAVVLLQDSATQLRQSPQPSSGPIDEFNLLLDQVQMATSLFKESVVKLRASTTPADGPTDADFNRFNQTERNRRQHAQKSAAARRESFGDFNRDIEEPARR